MTLLASICFFSSARSTTVCSLECNSSRCVTLALMARDVNCTACLDLCDEALSSKQRSLTLRMRLEKGALLMPLEEEEEKDEEEDEEEAEAEVEEEAADEEEEDEERSFRGEVTLVRGRVGEVVAAR